MKKHILSFLEYCEVTKNQADKTIENYRHYLGRFQEFLESRQTPDLPPKQITLKLINDYRIFLNRYSESKKSSSKTKPLSPKTQNYHVIALRALLKYLTKNDIETLAPEKIELPKIPERTVEVLDREELERLFEATDPTTVPGARDLAILETLYSTGLRVSELASLNRDQIDLKRNEFMVRGKGSKPRIVFLSDHAVEILKDYIDKRTDHAAPLFINFPRESKNPKTATVIQEITDPEKRRLSTVSIQSIVNKYTRKAGIIKKVTPHTLRHTYATQLLINGADIRSVQELLGHASITTTQIYTHVTNKALRETHEKFHK